MAADLASDLKSWVTPSDLDFTKWEKQLASETSGCGSKLSLSGDLHYGRSLFSTLESETAETKLAEYSRGTSSQINYLTSRWWFIPLWVVSGLLCLLFGIYVAHCAYKGRGLSCCKSKSTHPHDNQPVRSKLHGTRRNRYRTLWWLSVIILSLGTLTLASLAIVGGVQELESLDRLKCNGWLTLKTYFSGAQGLDVSRIPEFGGADGQVEWQGSLNMRRNLANLTEASNPATLRERAEALHTAAFTEASAAYKDFEDLVKAGMLVTREQDKLLTCVMENGRGDSDTDYGSLRRTPASAGARVKGFVLRNSFADDIDLLKKQASDLISIIFSDASTLASGINAVIELTDAALREVDASAAALLRAWKRIANRINDLAMASAILTFIFAVLAIITACLAFFCAFKLPHNINHAYRDYHKPPRKFRVTACMLAVMTGVAAVLTALHYTTAAIGSDHCGVGERYLLGADDWEVLGSEVVSPLGEKGTVDIESAFIKPCLSNGGSGGFMGGVGFESWIGTELDRELAGLRERAEELSEVSVRRGLHETAVDGLARFLQNALTARFHLRPNPLPADGGFEWVRELGHIHMDSKRDITIFYPFVSIDVDYLTSKDLVVPNGGWVKVSSQANAVDWINTLADHINNEVEDAMLPRVCGELALASGSSCVTGTSMSLIGMTDREIDTFVKQIPEDYEYRDERNQLRSRVGQTLRFLRDNEKMAVFTPTEEICGGFTEDVSEGQNWPNPAITSCVNAEGSPCQYQEWRLQEQARLNRFADQLRSTTHRLFTGLDGFVTEDLASVLRDLEVIAESVMDDSNCGFLRQAIDGAVKEEMCAFLFPAAAFLGLLWLFIFLVSLLLLALFLFLIRLLNRSINSHSAGKKHDLQDDDDASQTTAANEDDDEAGYSSDAVSEDRSPPPATAARPRASSVHSDHSLHSHYSDHSSGAQSSALDSAIDSHFSSVDRDDMVGYRDVPIAGAPGAGAEAGTGAGPTSHSVLLPPGAMERSPELSHLTSQGLDLEPYAIQYPTSLGTDQKIHLITTPRPDHPTPHTTTDQN